MERYGLTELMQWKYLYDACHSMIRHLFYTRWPSPIITLPTHLTWWINLPTISNKAELQFSLSPLSLSLSLSLSLLNQGRQRERGKRDRQRDRDRVSRLSYCYSTRISVSASKVCNYHSRALHLKKRFTDQEINDSHFKRAQDSGRSDRSPIKSTHNNNTLRKVLMTVISNHFKDWLCCVWAIHVLGICVWMKWNSLHEKRDFILLIHL